jgi:hypothetical protein
MSFLARTKSALRLVGVLGLLVAAAPTVIGVSDAGARTAGCGPILLTAGPVAENGWTGVHGNACGAGGKVRIEMLGRSGSRVLASTAVRAGGKFAARVKIPIRRGDAMVRASTRSDRSRPVKVKVVRGGPSTGGTASEPADLTTEASHKTAPVKSPPAEKTSTPPPATEPPATEPPAVTGPEEPVTEAPSVAAEEAAEASSGKNPECPLNQPHGVIETDVVSGCRLVASDTASEVSPSKFWGRVDCGTSPETPEPNQATELSAGGDEHPTATGAPQPDSAYRTMTVFDGDNIWGERCELGKNNIETGPTVFFREGMHRATFFSERLPDNFSLNQSYWQTVFQMKQTQPSEDADVGPMIEMQAEYGKWIISREWHVVWSFPAKKNFWTRFVFNVVYSQDPEIGSLQVGVDLNGDGDFTDVGEMSPVIHGATLATEIRSGDPTPLGGPIPSHLRAGIYHDERYECPRPIGCSTNLDNVQVMAP